MTKNLMFNLNPDENLTFFFLQNTRNSKPFCRLNANHFDIFIQTKRKKKIAHRKIVDKSRFNT